MDFKDEKCKKAESLIRKYMYENHRELWDKFKDDVGFPHQYDGAGILIHKKLILEKHERDLNEFERLIKNCESEVDRTAFL